MSLSKEVFGSSMKRILAVFSMTGEQSAAYLDSIFESVNWMDGYFFDQTCKDIVRNFKAGARKPLPTEFIAGYNEAKRRAGAPAGKPGKCRKPVGRGDEEGDIKGLGCEEIGWVQGWYRHKDGRLIEAVRPCPDCRPGMVFIKPELTAISREEYSAAKRENPFKAVVEEAIDRAGKD